VCVRERERERKNEKDVSVVCTSVCCDYYGEVYTADYLFVLSLLFPLRVS
jgi:hypothetical protein